MTNRLFYSLSAKHKDLKLKYKKLQKTSLIRKKKLDMLESTLQSYVSYYNNSCSNNSYTYCDDYYETDRIRAEICEELLDQLKSL